MWWLYAAQAAGMVIDWYSTENQKEIGRMGTKIEQAGIENQIQTNRLEAEDASLKAMQELRKNLGTQAAVFAARGQSSGAGSAIGLRNESISNFNSDERTRKINTLGKEANLRAQSLMANLHNLTNETQLGNQFRNRVFDKVPMSVLGGGDSSKPSISGNPKNQSYGRPSQGINDIKSLQG